MRALLLGLAAAAGIVSLAGCGSESVTGGGAVKLTMWETYNEAEHALILEIRDRWVAKRLRESGQKVELEIARVPFGGLLPKLKSSCLTGTTPDICRVDVAHVVPMAYGNALWPLDTVADLKPADLDTLRNQYVTAAIDSCLLTIRRKGKAERHLYGLPDQTNCVVLFYNKGLFAAAAERMKAAGLDPERAPATWDELVKYGQALSDPVANTFGLALNNSLWWTMPFLNTFGAEILAQDANGFFTCTLDDARAVQAFSLRAELSLKKYPVGGGAMPIEAGAWIPGAVEPKMGFASGRYAMVFTGPWDLDELKNTNVKFGVSLVPKGPQGSSSSVGGTNLVVFRSCKSPGLAYDWLTFVTSEEIQMLWCSRLGQIPVRPALFNQIDVSGKPELKTFFEQMLTAKARPPVPNYDKLEEIANAQMDLALQGKKSPQDALADATERINREVLAPLRE